MGKYIFRITEHHRLGWSHFFYYEKSRNSKRYPFANVKDLTFNLEKRFYIWIGQIQLKPFYRLGTYEPASKLVWVEFAPSNGKTISYLKTDIFCHFKVDVLHFRSKSCMYRTRATITRSWLETALEY